MCLEKKIDDLTIAINRLTHAMSGSNDSVEANPEKAAPAPTPEKAEKAAPAPTPEKAEKAAPAPTPEKAAPTPTPEKAEKADGTVPFTDPSTLMTYVVGKYKELGAERGAGIQQVMAGLTPARANINEINADQYEEFYAGVEAL